MADRITIEEILRVNPHITADELRELLDRAREGGKQPTPDRSKTEKRLVVGEEPSNDPRAVRLRYRR